MSKNENIPVMKQMCKTCPFRNDSPQYLRDLRPMLEQSALTEASRICHSSGRKSLFRKVAKEHFCRGARDFQIEFFFNLGFIEEKTDEAWDKKCRALGIYKPK